MKWDNMELAGQKATVFEPDNSQYHLLFSSALKRKKKLTRAEKEADLALKNAAKPSPWLFNHRAWIRWSRQDYQGAIRDWKRAAGLKPDRADFYARIAEGYHRTEQKALAKNYYQKALKLDPDNQGYLQKYQKLQAKPDK
jgi:tetratricopeptide (TPR) repeat protein